MLTESQARHLFAEAGAEIIPRPAPVDDLVRGGRRLGRVRRGLQVGGVLAAVALTVAVGLVWRQDPAAPSADVAVAPQAPPGTRLVGMDRVAVAVPEGWGTNAVDCDGHTAQRESVVFDSEVVELCDPPAHVDVSSLHIVESSSDWAKPYLSNAHPAGEIEGVPIARVPTHEDGARFAGALIVESEDVVMWVLSPDADVVDEILDSVVIVPDGYVTVPTDPNAPLASDQAAMETAGLSVEVVERFKPGWSAGSLISSDPPLGSVVPVGSTVTLVVTGEPSADIPIATSDWRPGDATRGAETGGCYARAMTAAFTSISARKRWTSSGPPATPPSACPMDRLS